MIRKEVSFSLFWLEACKKINFSLFFSTLKKHNKTICYEKVKKILKL
jgi:hypothetical protein